MRNSNILKIRTLIIAVLLSGCILPPDEIKPRVIDRGELSLVTAVKRGKDYALGGRADLAEVELRKALALSPDSPVIMSDLGYVLLQQNRLFEAKGVFLQTLAIDPQNLPARDNLARLLYREGDFIGAVREYEELIDRYFEAHGVNIPGAASTFKASDLTGAYRNLAILYALLGQSGDSTCFARLALSVGDNRYGILEHARFFLSQDRADVALVELQTYINSMVGELPSAILLDYGIALYLLGDTQRAAQAFARVPALAESDPRDRTISRVFRLMIAEAQRKQVEVDALIEAAREEDRMPCSVDELGDIGYWPQTLVDEVATVLKTLCINEKSSIIPG